MPNPVEEIQSFLGLINFVGKWIPNLATLIGPFRKLLRLKLGKRANIQKFCKTEQKKAFQDFKEVTNLKHWDTTTLMIRLTS